MIPMGQPKYWERKTCHSADFTWADWGSNPALRDERQATKGLIRSASNLGTCLI